MKYEKLINKIDTYFNDPKNIYRTKYGTIDKLFCPDKYAEDIKLLFAKYADDKNEKFEYKKDDLLFNLDSYMRNYFFEIAAFDNEIYYIIKSLTKKGYLIVQYPDFKHTLLARISNYNSPLLLRNIFDTIIAPQSGVFDTAHLTLFSEIYIYEIPFTKFEFKKRILKWTEECENELEDLTGIYHYWEDLGKILSIDNFKSNKLNKRFKKSLINQYVRDCVNIDSRKRFSYSI